VKVTMTLCSHLYFLDCSYSLLHKFVQKCWQILSSKYLIARYSSYELLNNFINCDSTDSKCILLWFTIKLLKLDNLIIQLTFIFTKLPLLTHYHNG
jgi:hypothetical protein